MKSCAKVLSALVLVISLAIAGDQAIALEEFPPETGSQNNPPIGTDIWTKPDGLELISQRVGSIREGPLESSLNISGRAIVPRTRYFIVDLKKTNVTKFDRGKTACHAGNSFFDCQTNVSMSVGKTISVGLGVSRGWMAAQLGWSNTTSTTVSDSCSKRLRAGQKLYAYPYGVQATYKIRRYSTALVRPQTSRTLTSFAPLGISCYVG